MAKMYYSAAYDMSMYIVWTDTDITLDEAIVMSGVTYT